MMMVAGTQWEKECLLSVASLLLVLSDSQLS